MIFTQLVTSRQFNVYLRFELIKWLDKCVVFSSIQPKIVCFFGKETNYLNIVSNSLCHINLPINRRCFSIEGSVFAKAAGGNLKSNWEMKQYMLNIVCFFCFRRENYL